MIGHFLVWRRLEAAPAFPLDSMISNPDQARMTNLLASGLRLSLLETRSPTTAVLVERLGGKEVPS